MSFRGSLLFVVRVHNNKPSKRTVLTTPASAAVRAQLLASTSCWFNSSSITNSNRNIQTSKSYNSYNSFNVLKKRQQFVGNRRNGIYFLSTFTDHTPTSRQMFTHPLIRTTNKRTNETNTTRPNNFSSPPTPLNDQRSPPARLVVAQGSKRRTNNKNTTTPRRNNNNTTSSMDLEQCMAQDAYNVNVIASRYGMCTIPLAIGLEALVSYMIDDDFSSYYSTSSQISIDILSTLVILHSSWLFTLSKCLKDLHTSKAGDPLSTLAQQWSSSRPDTTTTYTSTTEDTRRTVEQDDNEDTTLSSFTFMTQEEWDDARKNNKKRIRNSFDAGLYVCVSFLFASYPFVPLDYFLDDDDDILLFDPGMDNNVTFSSDMFLDSYGTLGICFLASFVTGRKAYKAWKALQHTPPTELPARIYLRRSAAFAN